METVKEVFEELLNAWESSEKECILEYGGSEIEMTNQSREYRDRFNKAYKRLINQDTGWSGPPWR